MRRWSVWSALVLVVAMLALPTNASAARSTLRLTPAVAIAGERVVLSGNTGKKFARKVTLQSKIGRKWRTVSSKRTTRQGAYRFVMAAPPKQRWVRVVAPAVRVDGRRHAKTVVKRTMRIRAQSGTLTAPQEALVGRTALMRGRFLPARPGRIVRIQRAVGSSWRTYKSLRVNRQGRFTVGVPVVKTQRTRWRAVAMPHRGARAVSRVAWGPRPIEDPDPPAVPEPPSDVVVGIAPGPVQTRLTATANGQVDRVRFFVDGVKVGEDETPPWSVDVALRAGRHDVMARAFGASGSALSPAVDYVGEHQGTDDDGMADGFSLEVVQSGFELPTSAAVASPQLVFVAEKAGVVKAIVANEMGEWGQPKIALDISASVINEADAGLVGLTVDPDFSSNGFVYVSYVLNEGYPGDSQAQQVARYTWDGTSLVADSRHVVLGRVTGPECFSEENIETPDCVPLFGRAHTIGDLAFDSEGHLLVGVGDGAIYITDEGIADRWKAMRSQNPDVLAGKVLRIDPETGHGVEGNPLFSGDGSSNASRVLAMGLRNPFRFAVEHDQRDLIIGDVGEAAFEELNRLDLASDAASPANFGWPCAEGQEATQLGDISGPDHVFHPCVALRSGGELEEPIHLYRHTAGGGSVTAGVFLTGEGYPNQVRGQFLYGDYAQNHLRSVTLEPGAQSTGLRTLASSSAAMGPVKIFTGPDGWAWSVSIYDGSLRRLTYGSQTTDHCPVGEFRQTFHDLDGPESLFDKEYPDDEWRWLYPYQEVQLPPMAIRPADCVPSPELALTEGSPWLAPEEQDSRAHPGDRFGVKWRGRVQLAAGTYRFSVRGSEWIRVRVDDEPVHDFYSNDFWGDARSHDIFLSAGQHTISVEYIHGDERDAYARLAWERIGGPPDVRLEAPANGWVTDGTLPWRVSVSDPDGDESADLLARTKVVAEFLHFDGEKFHSHPYAEKAGASEGTFEVDDAHAPGHGVVRLRATTTDASGARATSPPTYVCFAQGQIGPCATS